MAEIWLYVAIEASETRATSLVERIKSACEPFCGFPSSGAPRDVLAPGLRAAFVERYVVYYRSDDRHLVVVRVLHGARDAAALYEEGGFRED